jgi:hypothetical protein
VLDLIRESGAQRDDAHEMHADVTEVAPERCCSLICHRRVWVLYGCVVAEGFRTAT